MPDIFVPNDTSGISTYYINVFNAGLLQKFAFNYVDSHRQSLAGARDLDDLQRRLPSDDALLQQFADYAWTTAKIAPRWYYINLSANLIVSQLKGLIARDILGTWGYYKVVNSDDNTVKRALQEIKAGRAHVPVTIQSTN